MDQDTARKDYEISFLVKEEKDAEGVAHLLGKTGGEVTLRGPVEKITLSYPIKKEMSAYFGFFHFSFPAARMAEFRKNLQTEQAVLRFLIVSPPFVKAAPRGISRQRMAPPPAPVARQPIVPAPLSNEALERKIEEILQE